jgi:imidazoleglycerol-phosphate dehydratase
VLSLPDVPRCQGSALWPADAGVVETRPVCTVDTGIDMLDHLLTSMAFHGRFGLELRCQGDLDVDDHHSAEDCAIVLGMALRQALGDKAGIARFGHAYAPLDEALARAVVDLSGRPFAWVDLGLQRESIGSLACENIGHVVSSLANAAMITVHLDVIRGCNDHHRAEAAFKALGLALAEAVAWINPGVTSGLADVLAGGLTSVLPGGGSAIPSTKGSLDERGGV